MPERNVNKGFKRERYIVKLLHDNGIQAELIPYSGAVWERGKEDIKIVIGGKRYLVQAKSTGKTNRISVRYIDLSQLCGHTLDAGMDKSLFFLDYVKPEIQVLGRTMELPEELWVAMPFDDWIDLVQ